jgi:hypothetical protein
VGLVGTELSPCVHVSSPSSLPVQDPNAERICPLPRPTTRRSFKITEGPLTEGYEIESGKGMISYPRRLKSGHFTCRLDRTYHVLPTWPSLK